MLPVDIDSNDLVLGRAEEELAVQLELYKLRVMAAVYKEVSDRAHSDFSSARKLIDGSAPTPSREAELTGQCNLAIRMQTWAEARIRDLRVAYVREACDSESGPF